MRGLYVENGEVMFRDDLPPLDAADGECRVRVLTAGICATDLALARGYMGFRGVPGHEFSGVALDGPLAGRRVVGEINAACGSCRACASGLGRHCPSRTVLGILGRSGAFADELLLPPENLHAVPDAVPTEFAVFVEPLAAAFEIPAQVPLRAGMRALVVGDGRLGLLCAQVLALAGVEVDLAGRHPERGAWFGDTITHRGRLLDESGPAPERWELVVEASGDPKVLQRALSFVRPRGILVLKTTCEAPAALDLAPLVVDEVTLVGSRCGPFEPALAALAEGRIVLEPLLAGCFPLADGARAFEQAASPGALKIQVHISNP